MKTQNNENIIKDYDWSERLDHIAYMFNVRTKRKKYENFIINAIYTKVNNPELMPVTQQYVKNGNKYYLLDLYFPQINFGVEIDEGHHLNEENKESDKVREEGIKTAIACEEVRIPIYNENGKKRSYKDICQDIDSIVELIQKKIKEKGGVQWVTNEQEKKNVRKRGIFNVADNAYYNSITEIYNICGGKVDGTGDAISLQGCYYRRNNNYCLWVPKLTIERNGQTANQKYKNFLNEEKNRITEITTKKDFDKDPNLKTTQRAVFLRAKDVFGRDCIKFIGIFEFDRYENGRTDKRFFIKTADEVGIKELYPQCLLEE